MTVSDPRFLLHGLHQGVLSTHSIKEPGYPFGSALPFCLDLGGQPLLLVSELAQHTRNLHAEPKSSLTLYRAVEADQIQAGPRLVLLTEAEFLAPGESELLAPRYYRYLPSSPDYRLMTDFIFVRLKPVKVHFIAGFGQIRWLAAKDFLTPSPFTLEQENALCEDLNTREAGLLSTVWEKISRQKPGEPVALAGIDALGGDLRAGARLLRFSFDGPVNVLQDAWHLLHQGQVSPEED
ncbi:MAG: HugZ family protein [Candidatus Sericytochromatia bacterium]